MKGDIALLTPVSMYCSMATLTLSDKNAEIDFGYKPVYTMKESLEKFNEFCNETIIKYEI